MSLPEVDIVFLTERAIAHEIIVELGMTCIVLPEWPLPEGFDRPAADLLVRLTPGYPDVPPRYVVARPSRPQSGRPSSTRDKR